ncbi:MAG: hypothetical protein DMD33_02645 [Gemmatimonadetes bacterium]|nr:MAG: hypothetical protein DMD33_02645 [Gemmatimonadota bacterium]
MLEALVVAGASAAVVSTLGGVGVTALLPILAVATLIGFVRAPAFLSIALWSIIALIPEWRSDISVAPILSAAMYRSLVGPLGGADLVLSTALIAALSANPSALRSFWSEYRPITRLYGIFMAAVFLSSMWNGQLAHPIPLKPLFYLAGAVLWGYAIATNDSIGPWVPYLIIALAVIVGVQGLLNTLFALGREAAGFHLAFYDRASVFLLIVIVLFFVHGWLARSPVVRGTKFALWSGLAALCLLATAFSLRRTMWLALAVGVAVSIGLHAHRGLGRLVLRTLGVLGVAAGATLAILAALGSLGHLVTHVQSLVLTLSGRGQEESITLRFFETADVIRTIRHHPILGAGPLGQYVPSSSYGPALDRAYVHDQYLWLLLHYGAIGLVTFLMFWWETIRSLLRGYRQVMPTDTAGLTRLALGAALIGLAFGIFGDSFITAHHRWPLLLGFLLGATLGSSVHLMNRVDAVAVESTS